MRFREVDVSHPLYPATAPRETGRLKVSAVHTLFYATYGNPQGVPVVVLHGGPGVGCDDNLTRFFDLSLWNVVMFDQRGAMRSEPFGCTEENTPQHLVADIELLRKHLGVEKWLVFGGSWGSALALLYGQAHAERCLGFVLRGVFLGREADYLHLLHGMGKVFPEAYDPFIEHIPIEERKDLLSAYYKRLMDPNPAVHLQAARAFIRYDFTCGTALPNPQQVEKYLENDKLTLGVAKLFFYYAKHAFFLKPNQILAHMERIAHLPALIVQGRWDAICLPEMAYTLHKHWENSLLWMVVNGGHSANDPPIGAALATATDQIRGNLCVSSTRSR